MLRVRVRARVRHCLSEKGRARVRLRASIKVSSGPNTIPEDERERRGECGMRENERGELIGSVPETLLSTIPPPPDPYYQLK
eukprot:1391614-Amorphochlora_amoeboformis.AAC.1